jgi:hypothetical protein
MLQGTETQPASWPYGRGLAETRILSALDIDLVVPFSFLGAPAVRRASWGSIGETVTITDALPPGLKTSGPVVGADVVMGTKVSCTGLTCTYAGAVATVDMIELIIPVEVSQSAREGEGTNVVTVTGGGAPEVVLGASTTISSAPAKFGVAPSSAATVLSTNQAGAHPDLTSTLAFTSLANGLLAGNPNDSGLVLPPGFVGDLADTPKCPIATFTETEPGNFSQHTVL